LRRQTVAAELAARARQIEDCSWLRDLASLDAGKEGTYMDPGPSAWIRNSLRHEINGLRGRAKSLRRRYPPNATFARMNGVAFTLARVFDEAADVFQRELDAQRASLDGAGTGEGSR